MTFKLIKIIKEKQHHEKKLLNIAYSKYILNNNLKESFKTQSLLRHKSLYIFSVINLLEIIENKLDILLLYH